MKVWTDDNVENAQGTYSATGTRTPSKGQRGRLPERAYNVFCDALIGRQPVLLLMSGDNDKQGDEVFCVDDVFLRHNVAQVFDCQAACLLA